MPIIYFYFSTMMDIQAFLSYAHCDFEQYKFYMIGYRKKKKMNIKYKFNSIDYNYKISVYYINLCIYFILKFRTKSGNNY